MDEITVLNGGYNFGLAALSLMAAIAAPAVALFVVSRQKMGV
jgi:NO-binding membrane sensor protein with MHYT domain